jgi:hypothetical protein
MSARDETIGITIRFKPEVAEQLRVLARQENRSINGTVVEAVERYLRARRGHQPKENA